MRENPTKVSKKVQQLNRISPSGQKSWEALDGWNALTTVSFNGKNPTFNPSFGYPVKAFVNTTTGEVKVFAADLFTY